MLGTDTDVVPQPGSIEAATDGSSACTNKPPLWGAPSELIPNSKAQTASPNPPLPKHDPPNMRPLQQSEDATQERKQTPVPASGKMRRILPKWNVGPHRVADRHTPEMPGPNESGSSRIEGDVEPDTQEIGESGMTPEEGFVGLSLPAVVAQLPPRRSTRIRRKGSERVDKEIKRRRIDRKGEQKASNLNNSPVFAPNPNPYRRSESPASSLSLPSSPTSSTQSSHRSTPSRQSRQNRSRPSTAPSQGPHVLWAAFNQDDLPYKQPHCRMMMSIFYGIQSKESGLYHLTKSQIRFIDTLPTTFPVNINHTSFGKDRRVKVISHHQPFHILAQAALLSAAKARKWDIWDAYRSRCELGREGRNEGRYSGNWPSWTGEVGATMASEIVVPDDVLYQTIVLLFGLWGVKSEPNSVNLGNPSVPPIPAAGQLDGSVVRQDCLDYIRALAHDYTVQSLVRKVNKWTVEAEKLLVDARVEMKHVEKLLDRFLDPDSESRQEPTILALPEGTRTRMISSARKRARESIEGQLTQLVNTHGRIIKANAYNRPDGYQDPLVIEITDRLYEVVNRFDHSWQIDARGNQELTAGLQRFRLTSDRLRSVMVRDHQTFEASSANIDHEHEVTNHASDLPVEEETVYHSEGIPPLPTQHDASDLLTTHNLQAPLPLGSYNMTLGFPYFKYLDGKHANQLLGFPPDFWPRINQRDTAYNTEVVLRDHCRLGVLEMIARAYEDSPPGMPVTHHYKRGCVVIDGTGLGKTCQAIMLVGALSYLATELAIDPNPEHFPLAMLRNRTPLVQSFATDAPRGISPEITIKEQRIRILATDSSTPSAWGHFGGLDDGPNQPPNAPHIIIMPPQLLAHWKSELRRFSSDHLIVVEIVNAECADRVLWPVQQSCKTWKAATDRTGLVPPSDHVVLCSTSTLLKCYERITYRRRWSIEDDPNWDPLDSWSGVEGLYGLKYMTMIFDEVHLVKSPNKLHRATYQLARNSFYVVGQSATPMMNSPLDVCFLASALHFPHARNVAYGSKDMEPAYFQHIRRRAGAQRKFDALQTAQWVDSSFYQATALDPSRLPGYTAPHIPSRSDLEAMSAELGRGPLGHDPKYTEAFEETCGVLGPYFMGRTKMALDRHNDPLVRLGTIAQTIVNVQLRSDEIRDVHNYLEESHSGHLKDWSRGRFKHGDLAYYGPCYHTARAATLAASYLLNGVPRAVDEDFLMPTKINAMIDIIQIIKEREIEARSDLLLANKAKFAIHLDCRQVLPMVIYCLGLVGEQARVFDGSTSESERRLIEQEVNEDEDHPSTQYGRHDSNHQKTRILICTSVASFGLNLFRCNIVSNLVSQKLRRHVTHH